MVVGGGGGGSAASGGGGGEGERSRRMKEVILFLLRPLVGEKTSEVFSCHLHVRDREYDKNFTPFFFSSKVQSLESTEYY